MSHIWVPKFKIMEGEVSSPKSGLQGFFTLTRRKAETGDVIQSVGPFENLITNYGLNLIGTSAPNQIAVGSGTATPLTTDTTLQSLTALDSVAVGGSDVQLSADWPNRLYSSYSSTRRFNVGVATGTHAEVGVGRWDALTTTFNTYSRARIVDSIGNPTTITVLSDEVLDVTYELRHYIYPWEDSNDDVYTSLVLSSTSYAIQMRPMAFNVTSSNTSWRCRWNATMGNYTMHFYSGTAAGTPPGLVEPGSTNNLSTSGDTFSTVGTVSGYSPNSYTRSATITAGLSQGNLTYGLRAFTLSNFAAGQQFNTHLASAWQGLITPAIPKNSSTVMSFGVSQSWDRYTP